MRYIMPDISKLLNGDSVVLDKQLIEVTPENFSNLKKMIHNGKTCYLLLYANECGHCKVFKPVWKELSDEMKNELAMINAVIAQIELSNIKKIDDKYVKNVLGYPTIRKITKHELSDFKKGRNKDDLKKWMREGKQKGGRSRNRRRKRVRKTRKVYRKTPYFNFYKKY